MDISGISGYNGIGVISDVHSSIKQLEKAINYANNHGLYIVFLGDLIDGGHEPLEVVQTVLGILDNHEGVLCIGNHDDKHIRRAKGNPIIVNDQVKKTLKDVGAKVSLFDEILTRLDYHANAANYHRYNNTYFAHAGFHSSFRRNAITSIGRVISMRGINTDVLDERGWRTRIYTWADDLLPNESIVVGHDRTAMGKSKYCPLIHEAANGGTVYFTDTSCGKTEHGILNMTVFDLGKELVFNRFVPFTT